MTLKYRSTARKRSQNKCPKMKFGAFIPDPVLCIYVCKYTQAHSHWHALITRRAAWLLALHQIIATGRGQSAEVKRV